MTGLSHVAFSLLLSCSIFGCNTHRTFTSDPATGGASGAHHAHTGVVSPPRTRGRDVDHSGGGHHFEPRPHEPHYAVMPSTPPRPRDLPAFIDGGARCFRQPIPEPPYRPYPGPYWGVGSGAAPSGAAPSGAAPSGAAPSGAAPSGAAPSAPSKGATQGAARGAAPSAEMAPGVRALRGTDAPSPSEPSLRARSRDDEGEAPWNEPPARSKGGFGQAVYLSNDDTMSLSSAQRLLYAIDHYAPIHPAEVRPHELLNYFSFDTELVQPDHDFAVLPSAALTEDGSGKIAFGLAVQGRPLTLSTRRNANLSFVVDRSGSMQDEGRIDYVKRGLLRALAELKSGDIVHVTLFDTDVCALAQNFVVGRDSLDHLERLIARIEPLGSTNLFDGLQAGYEIADRAYRPEYTNRVVMVTDAIANTGVLDEELIALVGKHYDAQRIRLSGIGVGRTFNDRLLDRLTERGKGAYVFLGSEAEVDAVFGARFVSLIETIANDVHFKLHLPPSLKMDTFYGEDASTSKERVSPIHYFAGTSQMFLSDLVSRDGGFPAIDDIMLTIEYQDPEGGAARIEEFSWTLGEILETGRNLKKAQLVSLFARSVQSISERPLPSEYRDYAHSWIDASAASACQERQEELYQRAEQLRGDPEVNRLMGVFSTFCSRYQPVARSYQDRRYDDSRPAPLRQNEFAPPDVWPGAER
jgi:Ca-activated chloride channel family protein